MKKYIQLSIIVLSIAFILTLCGCNREPETPIRADLNSLAWRYDVEPITNRFPILVTPVNVFWKADVIGSADFGPTSYFLTGFVVLSAAEKENFLNKYKFEQTDLSFKSGIEPDITGFKSFSWGKSPELYKDIVGNGFVGDVFFDSVNGVLFIDVENL